jgi:replicative DNA helicase
MSPSPLTLKLLIGLGRYRLRSDHWSAWCPSGHRDESIEIRERPDGRPLLICTAGCTVTAVLAPLRLDDPDKAEILRANGDAPAVTTLPTPLRIPTVNEEPSSNSRGSRDGFRQGWGAVRPFPKVEVPLFPIDCLPQAVRDFVVAESVATQTPLDLAAMVSIGSLAAACSLKFRVRVWAGWEEPLNVYTMGVLATGNRKSPVFRDCTAPLEAYEEQMAWGDEDPERLLVSDATPEVLTKLLSQHGRIALMSPEGDPTGLTGSRYSKSGQPNIEALLKGYSGDLIRVDRITREPEYVKDPALTIVLTVQPTVLETLGDNPLFRDRGLLGRFWFVLPVSTLGYRDVHPPTVPTAVQEAYASTLDALLREPWNTGDDGYRVPHLLGLSPGARQHVIDFQEWIEPRLREGAELSSIIDWAAKLGGSVVRLAGLLHCAEHARYRLPPTLLTPISEQTTANAVQVGRYLLGHAKAAFDAAGADRRASDIRRVLRFVMRESDNQFTEQECWQGTKSGFDTIDQMKAALRALIERAYIREKAGVPAHTGAGRPAAPTYEINPALDRATRA